MVIAGLVWGLFGSVPTRVIGQGVLLADGKAAHTVQPIVAGPVVELLVSAATWSMAMPTDRPASSRCPLQDPARQLRRALAVMEHDLGAVQEAANELELRQVDIMLPRQKAVAEEQISAGRMRAKGCKEILTADESLLQPRYHQPPGGRQGPRRV